MFRERPSCEERFKCNNELLVSNELMISALGGSAIISSLETNNSLLHLNLSSHEGLSRNTLGPTGVKPLREVLKFNHYLAILNLAGNFIGDIGVGYLCEGL